MVSNYKRLVEREVQTGFSWLFPEQMVWRLPDGSIVENGTFAVGKGPDSEVDRTIPADNPLNSLMQPAPKAPIDTPERLVRLWVPRSEGPVRVSKRDATAFFSQFRITQELSRMCVRKGLYVTPELARIGAPTPDDPSGQTVPPRMGPEEERPGFPTDTEHWRNGKVWRRPAPRVIPMGPFSSVSLAQGLQDTFCSEARLPKMSCLHPELAAPGWLPLWGRILDDAWGVAGRSSREIVRDWFLGYDRVVERHGVKMSAKKCVNDQLGGEIQGLLLTTDRDRTAWLGLAPVKRARLMMSMWGLAGTRAPLVKCVQRAIGKYQHAALPQRFPLSALETLFFSETERKSGASRLTDARWEELVLGSLLVPLLSVDLPAPFDTALTATDASKVGLGVSEAEVADPGQIHQLAQNSCFRGDYTSLDCSTPGLFCWDTEAETRVKALRVDTTAVAWSHVMSIARRDTAHINVGEGKGHVVSLIRRLDNPRRLRKRGATSWTAGPPSGRSPRGDPLPVF